MGIGLITITKSIVGQSWTNVHAFVTGSEGALTVGDLVDIGVLLPFNTTTCSPVGTEGTLAGTSFLHSLITWERLIHDNDINFSQIYVSDGLNAPPGGDSVFWNGQLQFPGIPNIAVFSQLAAGPIVLQINKQPSVLSRRIGRGFFRGALGDGEIAFGSERLIDWRSSVQENGVKQRVADANVDSGLANFFSPASTNNITYCIPRYQSRCEPSPGALKGIIPVVNLVAVRPSVRSAFRKSRGTPGPCPT